MSAEVKDCYGCRKLPGKLRCGVCKTASYCSAECQRGDWQFHKRTCKKPTASPPAENPSPSAPAPAPTPAPAPAPSPKAASSTSTGDAQEDVEYDEEDLELMKSVKQMGYRYFSRKPTEQEKELLGDTTKPRKLDEGAAEGGPSVTSPTPSSGGSSSTSAAAVPTVVGTTEASAASSSSSSLAQKSAWNSAATFEERDLTSWFKNRLKDELRARRLETMVEVPGVGRLLIKGVARWEKSSHVGIAIARGKARYLYDCDFGVSVELKPLESSPAEDADATDDEKEEEDKKNKAGQKPAEDAAAKEKGDASSSATTEDKKNKKDKNPIAIIRFADLSTETENEREVRLEWGEPSPSDSQRELIKNILSINQTNGNSIGAVVRQVVESLVAEFKAK